MMSKLAAKALIKWAPVSPRIITARFNSKGRKVTLINCYAPTNNTTDELKQEFYDSLQGVLDHTPWRDIRILMGDLNAKIGSDNTGRERIMERHGLDCLNENGERFADFPASRGLAWRERRERDLCRLPTSCLMKPPTKFLVETYRFSKPVSFNV